VPDHSFSKDIFPNIQSEPPLAQLEAIASRPVTGYWGEETNTVPDGVILDSQTPREIQVLQLRAALGNLLDRHITHVGIDSQRQRLEPGALLRQVADGLVLQLATGRQVHSLQCLAVVGQAAQGQAVHPLAVSQGELAQVGAAQRDGHQRVPAELGAALQLDLVEVVVLPDDREQLPVRQPVGAVLERQLLQHFVVLQQVNESSSRDGRSDLRGEPRKNEASPRVSEQPDPHQIISPLLCCDRGDQSHPHSSSQG